MAWEPEGGRATPTPTDVWGRESAASEPEDGRTTPTPTDVWGRESERDHRRGRE